jgi:hypothetical protein
MRLGGAPTASSSTRGCVFSERLGAVVLKAEPRSLQITGTVAEWEQWTQMMFPESGDYWFPGGLATVKIDRDADSGSYWEPNVWMHHPV